MSGWDTRYQTGDTPWDLGGPSAAVMGAARSALPAGARVLVPGCGRGWHVEALAGLGHVVTGLDLSPTAVAQARARVGPHPGVSFVVGDLLSPPNDWWGRFDAVVEHTCFCALDPSLRTGYLDAVVRLLRPGGLLLGAFLNFVGGGPPYGSTPTELRGLFSPHFEVLTMAEADVFAPKSCPQLTVILRRRSRAPAG